MKLLDRLMRREVKPPADHHRLVTPPSDPSADQVRMNRELMEAQTADSKASRESRNDE